MTWSKKLARYGFRRIFGHFLQRQRPSESAPQIQQCSTSNITDKQQLKAACHDLLIDKKSVPLFIGEERIVNGDVQSVRLPHYHAQHAAKYYLSNFTALDKAISVAKNMREEWASTPVSERSAIWRRAADIISGDMRYKLCASSMLGQAKTFAQADDDIRQLIDELRQNADLLESMSTGTAVATNTDKSTTEQKACSSDPPKSNGKLSSLNGFVASIGPFNMISISASLALCPALMGNCVLWKPACGCVLPSYLVNCIMIRAGLPCGVLNFTPCNPKLFVMKICQSPDLGGISYGGSFIHYKEIIKQLTMNLETYHCAPRILAECGGKNFHFVHPTADIDCAVKATVEAAFYYAGQLYDGCSRLYVAESIWPQLQDALCCAVKELRVSDPDDMGADLSAVINDRIFNRAMDYLSRAERCPSVEIICGGHFCNAVGYFMEPTILRCHNPNDILLRDIFLGPVLSVFVYPDAKVDKVLERLNDDKIQVYSGAIFAKDDDIVKQIREKLQELTCNLHVNTPCIGEKPGSLTPLPSHDLAGTIISQQKIPHHLLQWIAPQNEQSSAKK